MTISLLFLALIQLFGLTIALLIMGSRYDKKTADILSDWLDHYFEDSGSFHNDLITFFDGFNHNIPFDPSLLTLPQITNYLIIKALVQELQNRQLVFFNPELLDFIENQNFGISCPGLEEGIKKRIREMTYDDLQVNYSQIVQVMDSFREGRALSEIPLQPEQAPLEPNSGITTRIFNDPKEFIIPAGVVCCVTCLIVCLCTYLCG